MQSIKHPQPNIHELFTEFDRLYAVTSRKDPEEALFRPQFSSVFNPILDAFKRWGGVDYRVQYSNANTAKITRLTGKVVVLCFSGGKDSTATAVKLRDEGENVVLYHLRGINKTYKDEWQSAEKVAGQLGLPLVVEDVTLLGNQDWVEHPLKNMILANRALQYAIREHKSKRICFGNFSTSTLDSDPFDVCGGDCAEMWRMYEKVVSSVIRGFHILTPLSSMAETLDILLEDPKLAVLPQSCIGPYRYRDYLHAKNVKSYNVDLPERRCGSCWKCCLEYIVYTDNGVYKYNEKFYKHCLDILKNTLYKETGIRYNVGETWNHYFFYSKDKSKYFQKSTCV